jgi:hypothetical protein
MQGFEYPKWMRELANLTDQHQDIHALFGSVYHVEFDQGAQGYCIAGFFQQCQFSDGHQQTRFHALVERLGRITNLKQSNLIGCSCLEQFSYQVGSPVQIGFMMRNASIIKLVGPPICNENIVGTKEFARHYFGKLLRDLGLEIDFLFGTLSDSMTWFNSRISIDLDLMYDRFLPRLSLEIFRKEQRADDYSSAICFRALLEKLGTSSSAIRASVALHSKLPYGEKRPVYFWSADMETMWIRTNHIKVSFDINGVSVKSYVAAGLSRG